MNKKILFVDDESKVLSGLRRMLRGLRHEWEMVFIESGDKALTCLDDSPFDVVVTDMRMPLMDGAQLLNHIVEQHPSVVRMILSGQCERNAVLKCVGPAHQFLTKPCDPEILKATIARACQLRDRLSCKQIQKTVSRVQSLPSHPAQYGALAEESQASTPSIQRISDIISHAPTMSAKVLQLVSSGFFGTPQKVYNIPHAVRLLGIETIRDLVDHTNAFTPSIPQDKFHNHLEQANQHCLTVAEAAQEIAKAETEDSTLIDSAYLAGILHDIAVYIFTKESDEEDLATNLKNNQNIAGAYLMGLWGLPDQIVNTIAYHLVPSDSPDVDFGPLAAVHVANAVLGEVTADSTDTTPQIDSNFMEKIGCADRLEKWREICLSTKTEGAPS